MGRRDLNSLLLNVGQKVLNKFEEKEGSECYICQLLNGTVTVRIDQQHIDPTAE